MTVKTGVRDTADLTSGRLTVPFDEEIALLEPKSAPLTRLITAAGKNKKKVAGPEFKHTEDTLAAKFVTLTAAATAGATSATVDDATPTIAGHIFRCVRTGEVMYCPTNGATTTVYLTRALGSTTNLPLVSGDILLIVGYAGDEAGVTPTELQPSETVVTQYTQIFETPFSVSKTLDASETEDKVKERAYLRKKKGIEHARSMELACWFSELSKNTGTYGVRRTMSGVLERVTTNVTVLASPGYLTEEVFDTWLETAFTYGSDKRVVFCAPRVARIISAFAKAKLQVSENAKKYGLAITTYVCAQGEVEIIQNPSFDKGQYAGMAVALDMGAVYYRFLRPTVFEQNIGPGTTDSFKDHYLSEFSIQIKENAKHSILLGVLA